MYIVVVSGGAEKTDLLAHGAPSDVKIRALRGPISKQTCNGFGQGGTSMSTAMRAAFVTKQWMGVRPYFYEVSENGRAAVAALKKSGTKLRGFNSNTAAMKEVLVLGDLIMNSVCFSKEFWLDGRKLTKAQLDNLEQHREDAITAFLEKMYLAGYDGAVMLRKAKELVDHLTQYGINEQVAESIGNNALLTTKIAAHLFHEALKVKPDAE